MGAKKIPFNTRENWESIARDAILEIPRDIFLKYFVGGFGKEQIFCDAALLGASELNDSEIGKLAKWFKDMGIKPQVNRSNVQVFCRAAQSRAIQLR